MTKTTKKWLIIALIDFFIILIFIGFISFIKRDRNIKGIYIEKPIVLNNFNLIDNHGKLLNKDDLKGHWVFIFFGFTHCEKVCPTTMTQLNKMYSILEKKLPIEQLPKIIFVTIDPETDSVAQLNKFVNAFNKNFIGARENVVQAHTLEEQLFVKTSKIKNTLNHTSDIILLNPEVKIQAFFPFPHHYQDMVNDFEIILKINQK